MTNKVNYRTLKDEQERVNEEIRQYQLCLEFDTTVALVEIYAQYDFQEPIIAMVNWGAIGSVNTKTADCFSKLIALPPILQELSSTMVILWSFKGQL